MGCFAVSADDACMMLEPTKILDKNLFFFAVNDNKNASSIGGSHWYTTRFGTCISIME